MTSSSSDYLDKKTCEELGILAMNWDEEVAVIGAMNTELPTVRLLAEQIEKETGKKTRIVQITTDEWEKWHSLETDELPTRAILQTKAVKEDSKPAVEASNKQDYTGSERESERSEGIQTRMEEERGETKEDDQLVFEEISAEFEEETTDYDNSDGSNDLHSDDDVVKAVANILHRCESLKASDIHIEPQEDHLRVRYRIDGILETKYKIPKRKSSGIIARTKIVARLDVAEKRLPQDGRIRVVFGGENHDFRVSTLPGKHGEKIVLRALRSDNSILDLGRLVSEERELSLIRSLGGSPYGIFIVVGPTGSGKSTTLYSILSEHNDPGINISTVEDPIEYTLPGIHQVQVVREKGLDFSRALRALMRQDPDVILVGETRDKETAQVAMEAALTGHMVFTTLHANDTATAVSRLSEMGVAPYLISSSVVGVMSQRLMRRVCPMCSSVHKSDSENELLQRFKIKTHRVADVRIGGGHINENEICMTCKGSGYKGRVGVYEVLKIDDEIRRAILDGKSADEIREASKERGMRTLLEYGMALVQQGVSTLEEVERVCMLEEGEPDQVSELGDGSTIN